MHSDTAHIHNSEGPLSGGAGGVSSHPAGGAEVALRHAAGQLLPEASGPGLEQGPLEEGPQVGRVQVARQPPQPGTTLRGKGRVRCSMTHSIAPPLTLNQVTI